MELRAATQNDLGGPLFEQPVSAVLVYDHSHAFAYRTEGELLDDFVAFADRLVFDAHRLQKQQECNLSLGAFGLGSYICGGVEGHAHLEQFLELHGHVVAKRFRRR